MELTIALALSILGTVISVCNFVLNRKDKSNKDIKEEHDYEISDKQIESLKEKAKRIEAIFNKEG